MRVGHGYDVHRFAQDVPAGGTQQHVVLGGVSIPWERPLLAHSDGDVLLHALCDALLGAIAAGDIGHHFPDTEADNAGIDSRQLLRRCMSLVIKAGYCLSNADSTIIAQAPRMASHVVAMRENIAEDLGAQLDQISVKATTTEGLGFAGRHEGIAVHAMVLLEREVPQQ